MTHKGIIYSINFCNVPVYVGQTINLSKRRSDHISESFNKNHRNYNTPIHKFIRSRPRFFEHFTWDVIQKNIPKSKLTQKEKYWIKKLDTLWPNGYNVRRG